MKKIIEVKNVSKKYTLGERQSYYSFRDTISGILKTPFRSQKLKKDEFWALKDISFDINEGDVVGIIGRNGAGKSTLLKILSQITPPTEGEIKLRGRVASLLEVGTGFHPELTGRENIYLNGAILGMKRWEINKKYNEIIEFAEIEKFIDTPVKHYSSGMYMRLAFSVAAHLEPEILLVDEVLAVGDAQFQKKCLGKMSEVSTQGRTIIFVSHDLNSISKLCKHTIWINDGIINEIGDSEEVIRHYLSSNVTKKNTHWNATDIDIKKKVQLLEVTTILRNKTENIISCDDEIKIKIKIDIREKINGLYGYMEIKSSKKDDIVFASDSLDTGENVFDKLEPGFHYLTLTIPKRILGPGEYFFLFSFSSHLYKNNDPIDFVGSSIYIKISDFKTKRGNSRKGYISSIINWHDTNSKKNISRN